MAKATVSIGNLDQLLGIAKIDLGSEFGGAMEKAMEAGEVAMKEAIATRGTGRKWTRPWGNRGGSYPGRIDSGDMQADVRGIVTEESRKYTEGNLGWDSNSPAYYAYQDQGFTHVLTDEDVEGMMALRDSAEVAERVLVSEVEDIVRRF